MQAASVKSSAAYRDGSGEWVFFSYLPLPHARGRAAGRSGLSSRRASRRWAFAIAAVSRAATLAVISCAVYPVNADSQ
jgi:hypothetical protein